MRAGSSKIFLRTSTPGHRGAIPGATYYAAFVLDPDGHRVEAVCHATEKPEVI
jgi:hypothetical protein